MIKVDGLRVHSDWEELGSALGPLVQNAIEATSYAAWVGVTLQPEHSHAVVRVGDTGIDMNECFVRERQFRPLVSTKETDIGIGADECKG